MTYSEEERYSLEDILLEFGQHQTGPAPERPDKSVPTAIRKPAEPTPAEAAPPQAPEEDMRAQEAALAARMRARRQKLEAARAEAAAAGEAGRIIADTVEQAQRERHAAPEAGTAGHGQVTMKFPAVQEMMRQSEESPPKPEELQPEPLNFAAFTKREVPPRKAPAPPTEEDIRRSRTSAPWRTTAEPGKHHRQPPEEKPQPRMRTIDLTAGQSRLEFAPDPEAFDPEEPEEPVKPRRRLPYDLMNRPQEDAGQAVSQLSRRLGGMAARLLLFFPVMLTTLYLTAAATHGLPIPGGITYEAYPAYHLGVLALCQLFSLMLAHECTLSGLWRLFHGRPTLDTLVTLSGLASLGYCVTAAFLPNWRMGLPYVCVNTVTGFFALLSKRQRCEALRRSYKALTMGTAPSGVKLYSDGKLQNLAVKTQSGVDVEPQTLSLPDFTERYSGFFAPLAIVLAVALAMSSTVLKEDALHFLWSLSAILSVSSPMCLLLSSSASGKRLGKKLYTSGSMLLNAAAAGRLARSRWAVLRDADLYPAGAVKITGMKIAENQEPEMVVGCAASLLQEVGGGLSKAFVEFARQMYIVPNKARELRFFDTRGIAATVSGKYVQLGTASYLMRMGIRVTEGLKLKNSIFIAIDSQFAGIFSMHYDVHTPVYAAFGLLKQARIRPVLALRDTNQTQAAVESRFELRRDTVLQPELEERLRYSASAFGREEDTLALLSRDGLLPFAEVLCAAKKWRLAARTGCILGTACALCGMLILAFLTGKSAVLAADPLKVLAYLVLWSLPAKLIRGIITKI